MEIESTQENNIVKSPLPGILSKYLVVEGQDIKKGDPLLVIEAMKMENTIPSPKDGIIKVLPLEPGNLIARGDTLLTIE